MLSVVVEELGQLVGCWKFASCQRTEEMETVCRGGFHPFQAAEELLLCLGTGAHSRGPGPSCAGLKSLLREGAGLFTDTIRHRIREEEGTQGSSKYKRCLPLEQAFSDIQRYWISTSEDLQPPGLGLGHG